MSEAPLNEPLAQFPDLARARGLYITLFRDDMPLVNLGYTGKQILDAKRTLSLIQGAGEIRYPENVDQQYLYYGDEQAQEYVNIAKLPRGNGFTLFAAKDPSPASGLRGLYGFLSSKIVSTFPNESHTLAHINLVTQNTIEGDLSKLVPEFYENGFFLTQIKVKPDSVLGSLSRTFGNTVTYRARWTDDLQRDFVVELKPPATEDKGTFYHHWRRLEPFSDPQGTLIPIGRKPSSSEEEILKMLDRSSETVFQGKLQWQPGRS